MTNQETAPIFRWEPSLYKTAANSQICDIDGHRLHACRTEIRSRYFSAKLDGELIGKDYTSIDAAKFAAEQFMQSYHSKGK